MRFLSTLRLLNYASNHFLIKNNHFIFFPIYFQCFVIAHSFFSKANFSLKNNQKIYFKTKKVISTYKKTSKLDNSKLFIFLLLKLKFLCFLSSVLSNQHTLLMHDPGTNFGCINYKEPSLSDL